MRNPAAPAAEIRNDAENPSKQIDIAALVCIQCTVSAVRLADP